MDTNAVLRAILRLDPHALDAIASELLRYRAERGDDRADIIDMLTLHPGIGVDPFPSIAEMEAAATS